jgi:glucose/arabinose dehydrogenase
VVIGAGLAATGGALAQSVTAVEVASGLTNPVFVTAPPGDNLRLFIVEQRGSAGIASRGEIRVLNRATNTIEPTPFLAINNLPVNPPADLEQGLLGLVFDPSYASNGFFYINYTNNVTVNGTTIIARYRVSSTNANVADPASATVVLQQQQPQRNHNGGWLAFGPDGYLYAALGDGGGGGDPNNNAQNLGSLLGKILRLNVSTLPYTIPPTNPFAGSTAARQEIWAYGLRNPWRPSFDRATGDLWIADVGQSTWEEINFEPAAGMPPYTARNYGWRCYEGHAPGNTTGCAPMSTMTFPVYVYNHNVGCSVTGGYVYRGSSLPALQGTYFFADWCANQIWSFRYVNGQVTEFTNRTAQLTPAGGAALAAITSFGEDPTGEMYFMGGGTSGRVFKIVPACYPNCDASTAPPILNVQDFTCFLQRYAAQESYANCDNSTQAPVLNVQDFTCFLQRYAAGCP